MPNAACYTRRALMIAAAVAAPVAATPANAAVVWSDDFTGETAGANPQQDNNSNGNDWVVVHNGVSGQTLNGTSSTVISGDVGNPAPSLAFTDTATNNSGYASFNLSNASTPFDMANPGQGKLVLKFDLRMDAMVVNQGSNSTLRIVLRDGSSVNNAFSVALGRLTLADGDAADDVVFYAGDTGAPAPSAANVIGWTGTGWDAGFDLGNYSTTGADNDSNDEFYRFELEFNHGSTTVTGKATRLSTGESTTFTRTTATALKFESLSAVGQADTFLVQLPQGGQASGYLDNIEIIVPEPGAAALLGVGSLLVLAGRGR